MELIQAKPIAEVLNALGAGRKKATDVINYSVGAELLVRVGQHVEKGKTYAKQFFNMYMPLPVTVAVGSGWVTVVTYHT